jgi:hypothetical protein
MSFKREVAQMKMIMKLIVYFLLIMTAMFITGCGNYARFVHESSSLTTTYDDSRMTINKLKEAWREYHVFYSGVKPHMSNGILFDPKHDDRVMRPDGLLWVEVNDEETMNELIRWTAGFDKYRAGLFRIIGPNEQFFGYIWYTDIYHTTTAKVIDDNTLSVYNITEPMRTPVFWYE